jgi:hypothetical protein
LRRQLTHHRPHCPGAAAAARTGVAARRTRTRCPGSTPGHRMGEGAAELVDSAGLRLATNPVRSLGAGRPQYPGHYFGANTGFEVGTGNSAVEA